MANRFWNFVTSLVPGTLARAEDVNTNLSGIQTGNDAIESELDRSIQITNAPGTTQINLNAAARANLVIAFDASGNVTAQTNIGNYRGNHAGSTLYYVRDVVRDAAGAIGLNNIYIANTQHTSSASIATDSANWDLVVNVVDVETAKTAAQTAQTAAETARTGAETAETNALASENNAQNWATLLTGLVETIDYSAKAWSIGGVGVTGGSGASKEWATLVSGAVDGASGYSAKAWAVGGVGVTDTAGRGAAKEWATAPKNDTVDGTEFSAKHYSEVAQDISNSVGGVANQFLPHEAAAPNMTVVIDPGRIWNNNAVIVKTQQTSATITAPSTNPRIDRVAVDQDTGNIAIITGTEAASPVAPDYSHNHIPVAQIALQTSTTQITNSIITDERTSNSSSRPSEGTWTPTIQDASLSDAEGQTYTVQYGSYTKIGSKVFIQGQIVVSSFGSLTTSEPVYLAGLPFNTSSTANSAGGICVNYGLNLNLTALESLTGHTTTDADFFLLDKWDASTGPSPLLLSDLSSDGRIQFFGQYITDE